MLLAVDIGNTNTVIGEFDGDDLLHEFRLKSEATRTLDEYGVFLHSLLKHKDKISAIVVSSVVPALTPVLNGVLEGMFGIKPLVVSPGIKTGLVIKVKNPQVVGADRIVNSVAAKVLYGAPAIVIDFGTATSFDVIDESESYCGGAIAPGVEVGLSGLVDRTAQLPRIALEMPERAIGRDTVEAMRSGTFLGYLCLVDGLIDRLKSEVGEATVIATGGLGRVFSEHSSKITAYDPHLTLKGLKELGVMNGVYSGRRV
jgi:type III pantothenate kinase